eukprot:7506215-Alexandrium_andersonii.AAC.1
METQSRADRRCARSVALQLRPANPRTRGTEERRRTCTASTTRPATNVVRSNSSRCSLSLIHI